MPAASSQQECAEDGQCDDGVERVGRHAREPAEGEVDDGNEHPRPDAAGGVERQ